MKAHFMSALSEAVSGQYPHEEDSLGALFMLVLMKNKFSEKFNLDPLTSVAAMGVYSKSFSFASAPFLK